MEMKAWGSHHMALHPLHTHWTAATKQIQGEVRS
jgi:hypothetical protein